MKYLVILLLITPAYAFDAWDQRIARPPEEVGIASIYSDHRTASGELFDAGAITCAHNSRPMCTALEDAKGICPARSKVTVRLGRRAVECRVNDRGPHVKGRVIDLTSGAARLLGLSWKQGLARVTLD